MHENTVVVNTLDEMKTLAQWVVWRLEGDRKRPYDPRSGTLASTTDPQTWATFDVATAAAQSGGYAGVGFVFTDADAFAFIDLDAASDGTAWKPHVNEWLRAVGGIWEVSQSGSGLHGIVRVPDKRAFDPKRSKWVDAAGNKIECYTTARFMACGRGNWWHAGPDNAQALLARVPDSHGGDAAPLEWDAGAHPDAAAATLTDEKLLEHIARADRNRAGVMFNSRASFDALWNSDAAALAACWPATGRADGLPYDASSADQSLANLLTWWTGHDAPRVERLMTASALGKRDKWAVAGYRRRTIAKAIRDSGGKLYSRSERDRLQRQRDIEIGEGIPDHTPSRILTLDDAIHELKFVLSSSSVIDTVRKTVRKYSAAEHEWAASWMDHPEKPEKRVRVFDMWENSRYRDTVDTVTWQPGKPEKCHTLGKHDEGITAYNIWAGLPKITTGGDPSLTLAFDTIVGHLFPIEGDRKLFWQWLAHAWQQPGEVPHHHFLLIAKKTGTGRGTLTAFIARVFEGYVALGYNVDNLMKDFNGQLSQKLFTVMDEVREADRHDRRKLERRYTEEMTLKFRLINNKYGLQLTEANAMRWIMCSNYPDAVPMNDNERRIYVVEQPEYLLPETMYAWIRNQMEMPAVINAVRHKLATMDISGYNPGMHATVASNAVKRKILEGLKSDFEREALTFKQEWPCGIATMDLLKKHIQRELWPEHNVVASRILNNLGIKPLSGQRTIGLVRERIVLLNDSYTEEHVKLMPSEQLKDLIENAKITYDQIISRR